MECPLSLFTPWWIFTNISFYQTVLFNLIYQFETSSAFTWCIQCQYQWKVKDSQKFSFWKLKILCDQMKLLWHQILEILWITGWFSKFLWKDIDPKCHLRTCIVDLGEKLEHRTSKNLSSLFKNTRSEFLDQPKSSV